MIPDWTRDYLGREYKPPYGCFLLVVDVLREQYGIDGIPDFSDGLEEGGFRNRATKIYQALESNTVEIMKEESRGGDIVTILAGGYPVHIGILVDNEHILHMVNNINVCVENINRARLRNRIGGYYRVIRNDC